MNALGEKHHSETNNKEKQKPNFSYELLKNLESHLKAMLSWIPISKQHFENHHLEEDPQAIHIGNFNDIKNVNLQIKHPHFLIYINSELEEDLTMESIDFLIYCLLNDLATLTNNQVLWIVTDGVNKVASQIVDKIIQLLPFIQTIVIGVSEWKENYAIYFDDNEEDIEPKYCLNRNHTHFLFYDDSGLERKRTLFFKFIEEIKKNIQKNEIFGFSMSPIQIFIKGDLKNIHSALIKDHIVVAVHKPGEDETDFICNQLNILAKQRDEETNQMYDPNCETDRKNQFAYQICKEYGKKIFSINLEEKNKNYDKLIKIASLRCIKKNFIIPTTSAASFLRSRQVDETGTIPKQHFSKEHQLNDPKFLVIDCPVSRTGLEDNLEPWSVSHCAVMVCLNCGLEELDSSHTDRIYSVIRTGLFNVPTELRVCIVTDAVNPGVAQLINKAVHEQRTRIAEKRELTIIGIISKEDITETTKLQANHSHFILSQVTEDCALIKQIIATEVLKNESVGIPAIQMFIGGDLSSLKTMCDAKKLYGHIILLMKGSGGVTDMVCESIDQLPMEWNDEDEAKAESLLKTFIGNRIDLLEKNMDSYVYWLRDFVSSNRENIMIIDYMNSAKTLYDVIISGMFYYEERSLENLIILAMTINELNLAQEFMSRNNPAITLNFDDLITKALINDQADFVELFIEHDDFSVNIYIQDHLATLYEKVENELLTPINNLIDDLVDVASQLTNNISPPVYNGPSAQANVMEEGSMKTANSRPWYRRIQSTDIAEGVENDPENAVQNEMHEMQSLLKNPKICAMRSVSVKTEPDRDYDSKNNDLLFWAILSHRFKVVRMLWLKGSHHISSALVISTIMKNLAKEAKEQIKFDLADEFAKESKEYETFALYLLNEAQIVDKVGTELILLNKIYKWNGNSCLKLALAFETQNFIAHNMCERLITKQWNGSIPVKASTINLWFNIFLFPILNAIRRLFSKCCTKSMFPMFLSLNQPDSCKRVVYLKQIEEIDPLEDIGSLNSKKSEIKQDEVTYRSSPPPTPPHGSFIGELRRFYTAPVTIFWTNAFSHVTFLLIFSYFTLFKLNEFNFLRIHWSEIFVWTWCFGFTLQETYQMKRTKWQKYIESRWNKYDLALIMIMIICVLLRFLLPQSQFQFARLTYCLLLGMLFIRTLQFYFVHPSLGPKVYMIQEMFQDVFFFLGIFLIFILSYGTLRQALMFPNGEFSFGNITNILYYPYWQTYGELILEDMNGDNCSSGDFHCQIRLKLVWIIFAVFMLATNVLLVNLLIAMFGFTFEKVQKESEKIHLLYRVNLLEEFSKKSPFPPPFNICQFYLLFHSESHSDNVFVDQSQGNDTACRIKTLEDKIMISFKENENNLGMMMDSEEGTAGMNNELACTQTEMQSALDELTLRIENNFESILSSKQEIINRRLMEIEKKIENLEAK